jgi:molybdopterin-containing oxidoreductase family membrane subunit
MKEQADRSLFDFSRDVLRWSVTGNYKYYIWMGTLALLVAFGLFAYTVQLREGLGVTGMNDHIAWGLYISNFTFLVGIAAASVMLMLPAYILKDLDFAKSVLIGEGLAVTAIIMCIAFIIVDVGSPIKLWHMLPFVGYFNWPQSMFAWDALVLGGYFLLNLLIPLYILYCHYRGQEPNTKRYLPFVFLSVIWAISIHLVTAFLYAGLPSRPYWHNALLGPHFLASAFTAGPALMILILHTINKQTPFQIAEQTNNKLALIVTVAAQINLIMLGSDIFKEFYAPTQNSASATYLYFGLQGHNSLVPIIWTAIGINIIATLMLTIHKTRRNPTTLFIACAMLFVAIGVEKGVGTVVPGFIPTPLGKIVDYVPTWVEIAVTVGIWAMGLMIFTLLTKAALRIEIQYEALKHNKPQTPDEL